MDVAARLRWVVCLVCVVCTAGELSVAARLGQEWVVREGSVDWTHIHKVEVMWQPYTHQWMLSMDEANMVSGQWFTNTSEQYRSMYFVSVAMHTTTRGEFMIGKDVHAMHTLFDFDFKALHTNSTNNGEDWIMGYGQWFGHRSDGEQCQCQLLLSQSTFVLTVFTCDNDSDRERTHAVWSGSTRKRQSTSQGFWKRHLPTLLFVGLAVTQVLTRTLFSSKNYVTRANTAKQQSV